MRVTRKREKSEDHNIMTSCVILDQGIFRLERKVFDPGFLYKRQRERERGRIIYIQKVEI